MSVRKRFIVASRVRRRFDAAGERSLAEALATQAHARDVRRTIGGRRVVEMTIEQSRTIADHLPNVIIEEDRPLAMFSMPGLSAAMPDATPYSLTITVIDLTDERPIQGVTIFGVGDGVTYRAVSDADGRATLKTAERRLRRVIISPRDTYWSCVVRDVPTATTLTPLRIRLRRLFVTGAYDWGHRVMGFRTANQRYTGRDVSVAVVDSGVTGHDDAWRLGLGHNAIPGSPPDSWQRDESGHGTHVAGVIAGRSDDVSIVGGAPDARLCPVKVFPGGCVSDLIEALEWCIERRIDVISLPLGIDTDSQILGLALRDAHASGITVVAAVGNGATHVAFPAALPHVIAVGAVGQFGTFPEDSAHALHVTSEVDSRGKFFSASFTNFGRKVDVCAPGVAVVSTVPTGYAAWDGTSMSCAFVSAMVAIVLQACPSLRSGRADQVESVRAVLMASVANLGISPLVQGGGMPDVVRGLRAAQTYGFVHGTSIAV